MVELRKLFMRAPLLNTSALGFLPKVELLDVTKEEYSEGGELARHISKEQMPCLRKVHVHILGYKLGTRDPFGSPMPVSPEDEHAKLQVLKELRSVCEPQKISVSDTYISYWDDDDFN